MKFVIGIDLGTQSAKAIVCDTLGGEKGLHSVEYPVYREDDGSVFQQPSQWWDAVCQSIRGAMGAAGIKPADVLALGLSGQMHGLVGLDERNAPVAPARIWMDTASAGLLKALPMEEIAIATKNRPATGFLAITLAHMKKREPDLYRRIKTVLLPKDYIRYRLCGALGTDYTDASGTMAFDPVELRWSERVLEILDLDISLFPSCNASCDIAGELTSEAAAATGLLQGTPVVYGGGDNAMQNVGLGLLGTDMVSSNIGTAAQVTAITNRPVSDAQYRLNTFSFVEKGLWSIMGGSLCGGGVLSWLAKRVLRNSDIKALDEIAAKRPPCPNGLLFLPYLAGERAPLHDPYARGVFFGLGEGHTDADLYRAVLEGVVFALNMNLEVMQGLGVSPQTVVASGGGAHSALWRQIQADIYGRKVYLSQTSEQASLGAAIVAAAGAGVYPDLASAVNGMTRLGEQIALPNPERHAVYKRAFQLYKQIYETNRRNFLALHELRELART